MAKLNPGAFFKAHKKPVLIVSALVLAAAIGCGAWFFAGRSSSEPVYVFPFHYIGMTEYWGDTQESYGPVTTDKIQTVFLSDTQTVTEVAVKEGDTVKKGDLILSFDTTLSDLQLERKRLDVEKLKLQLEQAQRELGEINMMVPMQEYVYEDSGEYDEDLGRTVNGWEIYGAMGQSGRLNYDGSSEMMPLILWISGAEHFNSHVMDDLHAMAVELQTINRQLAQETEPPEEPSEDVPSGDASAEEDGSAEQPPSGEEPQPDPDPAPEGGSGDTELPDAPPPEPEPVYVSSFYVVVRVTENDQQFAAKNVWQGLQVYMDDYGLKFYSPVVSDPFMEDSSADDTINAPSIDFGSGFTAAQIAQMRSDKEKEIKDLQFKVKMADAEYKIMQTEVSDGNVYSEIDGEVVSLLTEEEAKSSRQPMVKVSGGGGFYVEGFVNELEKDKMVIGMEVTVNDWNNGMTYTGEVASLGDFPTQEGYWNGMGNPNSSFYPFRVFIDGSADLQAGSYVSVMYSTSEGGNGVYLENPFLRTEGGKSYVMVLGADGTLEQRYVTTGKSLWGSYTEIKSGLTPDDLIAFPYGKNVKPGVKAVEGDLSNLYN